MKVQLRLRRFGRHGWRVIRVIVLAFVSPLFEKGPSLGRVARALEIPLVLSMRRLVVLGFAVAVARQVALAGVTSWPEATLAIMIVIALPLMAALERVDPEETVKLAHALITRLGVGTARTVGSLYAMEPSKFDDHRDYPHGPKPARA